MQIAPICCPREIAADAMVAAAAAAAPHDHVLRIDGTQHQTCSQGPSGSKSGNPIHPLRNCPLLAVSGPTAELSDGCHQKIRTEGQLQNGHPGRMPRAGREINSLCDGNEGNEHGSDTGNEPDEEARRIDQRSLGEEQEDHGNDVDWRNGHDQRKGKYPQQLPSPIAPLRSVRAKLVGSGLLRGPSARVPPIAGHASHFDRNGYALLAMAAQPNSFVLT